MASPFTRTRYHGEVAHQKPGQPSADYLVIPSDHGDFGAAADEAGGIGYIFRAILPRPGQSPLALFERLEAVEGGDAPE